MIIRASPEPLLDEFQFAYNRLRIAFNLPTETHQDRKQIGDVGDDY